MKILVFGSSGLLGHKLIQVLSPHADVSGTLRRGFEELEPFGILDESRCIPNIDAADEGAIREAIKSTRPDVVLNAIGVVKQLPTSKDVITILTINSIFPHRLAHLSDEFGFRLITISTDCIFDGVKGNYTEGDVPNAIDLYGKSKNFGEVDQGRALTLRTSIIGRELRTSHSLVEWFLSNEGGVVKGFRQAIYSGFPTVVLANIIKGLIFEHPDLNGLYHVSSDPINKYELLELLKKYYKANIKIEPSDDFRIDRSLDSTRFRSATGFKPTAWPEMIEQMASDPTPYHQWK
jgi:dTDP-4-dehydrorhamnose reductase